jgi:signal transduction histidine kinase
MTPAGADLITLGLYMVAAVSAALAVFVLSHASGRAQNRAFSLTVIAVAGWTLTNALFRQAASSEAALLWAQLSYVAALLIAASFLHFAHLYPVRATQASQGMSVLTPMWLMALSLGLLSFVPDAVVTGIDLESRRILTGSGLHAIALFMLLTSVWAFALFWRSQSRLRGREKERERAQARYVLFGAALTALTGLFFNLLLPLLGNYSLVWLGPVGSLFFVGSSAYSIVAHRLFDIRLLIRRTLVYAGLLFVLTALFSALVLGLTNALRQVLGEGYALGVSLGAALLIGLGVEPLRRGLETATDSFLFQRERQEQAVLVQLSRRLGEVDLQEEVVEAMLDAVAQAFRPRAAALYLPDAEADEKAGERAGLRSLQRRGALTVKRQTLARMFDSFEVPGQARLFRALDDPQPASERGGEAMAVLLLPSGSTPLRTEGQQGKAALHASGTLLVLGGAKSGRTYSQADAELLEAIAAQGTSALQRARLIEGDKSKSEFVSIAAHELLTPITAIEGYLSMMLDEGMAEVDERGEKYLRQMQFSARRLSGLVKDLLSLSRLEAGRITFAPQPFDLAPLLADVAEQLRPGAQAKGLELKREEAEKPLPAAWADPDRVTQVLVNLIGNAVKYTLRGRVTVSARVQAAGEAGGSQILVSVRDTGLGLSPQAQRKLFEKFYRVDSPERRSIPGTGLGLYITKSMVEKMGGAITVQSKEGEGSTFSFTLPVASSRQSGSR